MKSNLPISPYKEYCNGFAAIGTKDLKYILGVTLGVGISDLSLSHSGSTTLDEINAFDLAEVDGPYIGQLNMSTVSSFCGPEGLIWGYDLANNNKNKRYSEFGIKKIEQKGDSIEVYNGDFLVNALEELFGTVSDKRNIIKPGSHTPFASKNIKIKGPAIIYSAIGIGIPEDREKNACLLMEDIGQLDPTEPQESEKRVVENLARSIISIGQNQDVKYTKCLITYKYKAVKEGEIGCALVAAPYFTIAQEAIPSDLFGNKDYNKLKTLSLEEWIKTVKK